MKLIDMAGGFDLCLDYLREMEYADVGFTTMEGLLTALKDRMASGVMLVTDVMRKELFDYLGSKSHLFTESDGEVSISIVNLDSLLKAYEGPDNVKKWLQLLDDAGCKVITFEELEEAMARVAGGGPALRVQPELKMELIAALKRDDSFLLQEDQHQHFTDEHVAEIMGKCRGWRFALQTIQKMHRTKVEYPTMGELMSAIQNSAQYIVRVDDDMRQDVMEVMAAPGFNLFAEVDDLEFTIGEIDDLITLCLGAVGTRAALMRLNFRKQQFSSFKDLMAAIPHHPFPDASQRAQLLQILRTSPGVDATQLASLTEQHLNELLVFGGGADSFEDMLKEAKLEGVPVEQLGYILMDFYTPKSHPGSPATAYILSPPTPRRRIGEPVAAAARVSLSAVGEE
jgi:hypothetical protein